MDRLNSAAVAKMHDVLVEYNRTLASDLASSYGLDAADLLGHTSKLMVSFFNDPVAIVRHSACAWFTKRGEPCNKERRPGCDYCTVHAEYFKLHNEEVSMAKSCPGHVNVTRKGINKLQPGQRLVK
jgi:hypothetical protein